MKLLTAFAFFILLIPTYGQKTHKSQDTLPKFQVREILTESSKEVEAYKLLYDTSQKSNDNLRETTQWTIGIVIGFILLILGSQFLYNWRLNKQEVETIKSEMETKFKELQNNLLKEKEQILNELKVDISKAQKENRKYLYERYLSYQKLN